MARDWDWFRHSEEIEGLSFRHISSGIENMARRKKKIVKSEQWEKNVAKLPTRTDGTVDQPAWIAERIGDHLPIYTVEWKGNVVREALHRELISKADLLGAGCPQHFLR